MESTIHGTPTGRTTRQALGDIIALGAWDDDVLSIYRKRHSGGIDFTIRKLSDGHYRASIRDSVRGLLRFASTPIDCATEAMTDYLGWINSPGRTS